MMMAFIAALNSVTFVLPTQACEFFPLTPGMEWEYIVTYGDLQATVTQYQRTLEPITIQGIKAIPMEVIIGSKPSGTSYYAIQDRYVYLVATSPDALLAKPIPVLPVNPKTGDRWQFEGATPFLGDTALAKTSARVVKTEKTAILGKTSEVIRVIVETQIGQGPLAYKVRSTEHYAKGVGLVYRKQEVLIKGGGVAVFQLKAFKTAPEPSKAPRAARAAQKNPAHSFREVDISLWGRMGKEVPPGTSLLVQNRSNLPEEVRY